MAIVKFEDPEAAQSCVAKLNGRYFGRRQLEAMLWDGITDYNVKESEESKKRRLAEFGKWIEEGSGEAGESDLTGSSKSSSGSSSAGGQSTTSGSATSPDSAPAHQVAAPMPKLSAAGQAVANAAEELLSTATDSMLESYITVRCGGCACYGVVSIYSLFFEASFSNSRHLCCFRLIVDDAGTRNSGHQGFS